MDFWRRNSDRDLERRLRDERPQARDEFVRMLAGESPTGSSWRRETGGKRVPRLAVLAAATALLAASLGVTGALGSAPGPIGTFCHNFFHIVWSNKNGTKGDGGNDGNYCTKAWCYQYHHHKVPICDKHYNLTWVYWTDWLSDFKNGYTPANYDKTHKFYCGKKYGDT